MEKFKEIWESRTTAAGFGFRSVSSLMKTSLSSGQVPSFLWTWVHSFVKWWHTIYSWGCYPSLRVRSGHYHLMVPSLALHLFHVALLWACIPHVVSFPPKIWACQGWRFCFDICIPVHSLVWLTAGANKCLLNDCVANGAHPKGECQYHHGTRHDRLLDDCLIWGHGLGWGLHRLQSLKSSAGVPALLIMCCVFLGKLLGLI